jgi:hypothetical protein
MKNPFFSSFLEDYVDDSEIKAIIEKEKCNIIPYNKIDKDIILDNYDYIIITETDELNDFIKNDRELYDSLHKKQKLFYIGDYDKLMDNSLSLELNIKHGLNICHPTKKPNRNHFMSNLLINISLTKNDNVNPISFTKFLLNYLTSSVTQINIEIFPYMAYASFKNLPNKIRVMHMNQYNTFIKHNQKFNHKELSLNNYGRIKFSRNTILVVTEHKYHDNICLNAKLASMTNLKINHVLMKQSIIKDVQNGMRISDYTVLEFNDLLIIKNNKNIYLNYYYSTGHFDKDTVSSDFHNYNRIDTKNTYCKEKISQKYEDLWNMICLNICGQKMAKRDIHKTLINVIPKNIKDIDQFIKDLVNIIRLIKR